MSGEARTELKGCYAAGQHQLRLAENVGILAGQRFSIERRQPFEDDLAVVLFEPEVILREAHGTMTVAKGPPGSFTVARVDDTWLGTAIVIFAKTGGVVEFRKSECSAA